MSDGAPADEPTIDDRRRKRALAVAFVTLFLDLLGFGIIIPIQPFYAESFGATPTVVTLLGASYSAMQFLFAPMWGRLSDRVGRRPVVLLSVAFGAVGFLVFGLAQSLVMLFVARMIAGFGNANLGTVQALVADVTPGRDRAKAMGLIGAAFGLGFVFGPVIGGLVGSAFGPAAPAFVSAAFAAINWLLAFALLPETRRAGVAAGSTHGFLGLRALGQARAFANVPRLLLIIFVFTTGFSLMETSLALFVEHEFVPPELFGSGAGQRQATRLTTWVLLAVGVTAVIVQGGLIGPLRRRLGEKSLVVAGAALCALSFVGIALVPSYAALFAPIVVLSVGSGVFSPSQSSLLSRSVDAHQQGVMLGLSQSMSALGRILGPAVSGLLFERAHGAPFLVGATLLGAGAAVALGLRPAEPPTSST
ncbi:MAG: MFS transporter [Deltaproteobacteria bacterium]|nr:MFS transporter [Deltaproteobacteria bacterium]